MGAANPNIDPSMQLLGHRSQHRPRDGHDRACSRVGILGQVYPRSAVDGTEDSRKNPGCTELRA